MKHKNTSIILIVLFALALALGSCGSRKTCSKKGKTKVDMGWM
jgi:hypothetical protein